MKPDEPLPFEGWGRHQADGAPILLLNSAVVPFDAGIDFTVDTSEEDAHLALLISEGPPDHRAAYQYTFDDADGRDLLELLVDYEAFWLGFRVEQPSDIQRAAGELLDGPAGGQMVAERNELDEQLLGRLQNHAEELGWEEVL